MATGLGRVTRHLLPLLTERTGWQAVFAFPQPIALPDAVRYAIREFDPQLIVTFIDNWWVDWFPYVPERGGRKWLLYRTATARPSTRAG